nr:MAG TPA: hypothetical protein [Bacteriophage sp.]
MSFLPYFIYQNQHRGFSAYLRNFSNFVFFLYLSSYDRGPNKWHNACGFSVLHYYVLFLFHKLRKNNDYLCNSLPVLHIRHNIF